MSKKEIPSDNATVHNGMLTYVAMPHPIPAVHRLVLEQIGADCNKARLRSEYSKVESDVAEYLALQNTLDAYERNLRKNIGVPVTRPVIYDRNK